MFKQLRIKYHLNKYLDNKRAYEYLHKKANNIHSSELRREITKDDYTFKAPMRTHALRLYELVGDEEFTVDDRTYKVNLGHGVQVNQLITLVGLHRS